MNGHERAIASLVRLRADVDARDVNGNTPLHQASRAPAAAFRRLLAARPDPSDAGDCF